jgi:hypothetical protein
MEDIKNFYFFLLSHLSESNSILGEGLKKLFGKKNLIIFFQLGN